MPERYAVGVVNYKTYDDLARCLDSVKAQTHRPEQVLVVDVEPDPSRLASLREAHPDVRFIERPNRGFGAGANEVLRVATGCDAVLVLNPDIELSERFGERLLGALRDHPGAAIASGKLLRPDGTIDSAGIALPRHRRPEDRGSGEPDHGQYDRDEAVFAVCGAAMMIRASALSTLAIEGEIFDEDFFTYREDTDLCWRAGRLGYEVRYVPAALATHVRRWRPGSTSVRRGIPLEIRRHSFKNHYLQLLKNEEPLRWLRDLPVVLGFEVARFAYVLVTDPLVLAAYPAALASAPRALAKRRRVARWLPARRHARPIAASREAAVAATAVVPSELS